MKALNERKSELQNLNLLPMTEAKYDPDAGPFSEQQLAQRWGKHPQTLAQVSQARHWPGLLQGCPGWPLAPGFLWSDTSSMTFWPSSWNIPSPPTKPMADFNPALPSPATVERIYQNDADDKYNPNGKSLRLQIPVESVVAFSQHLVNCLDDPKSRR